MPAEPRHASGASPIHLWASRIDTLPGDYTRVTRLVEMSDQVLVLSDAGEDLVWRVELASGTRVVLGSRGDGPGEYRSLGPVVKTHRDSIALLFGTAISPFSVISSTTGLGRTHSLDSGSESASPASAFRGFSLPRLLRADTMGHVYGTQIERIPSVDARGRFASVRLRSMPIVRYSLTSGAVDTLAEFAVGYAPPEFEVTGDDGSQDWIALQSYGAYNQWTAGEDGRLLIVDAARYELRVLGSDGTELHTWRIPYTPVAVAERGWQAYVKQATSDTFGMTARALQQIPFLRNQRSPPRVKRLVPPMPRVLPPVAFRAGLVRSVHWVGELAAVPVNLSDPPGSEYWDLINSATGLRVATLALPAEHRVVHVGILGVYVVWRAEHDLERVLLYRFPAGSGEAEVARCSGHDGCAPELAGAQ